MDNLSIKWNKSSIVSLPFRFDAFVFLSLDCQLDQPCNQFGVRHPAVLPKFGIHAYVREPGQGVYFIQYKGVIIL